MVVPNIDPEPLGAPLSMYQAWCARCGRRVPVTDTERKSYTRDNRPRCCGKKMCCLPALHVPPLPRSPNGPVALVAISDKEKWTRRSR